MTSKTIQVALASCRLSCLSMHSRLYVKMRVQVLNQSQKLKAQQLTQQFRLFTATQRHMSSQSLAKHFHNQDLLLLLFQTLPSHQHLLFQHLCRSTFQRLSVCTRYFYDPCFMNACTTSCHAHVLQLYLPCRLSFRLPSLCAKLVVRLSLFFVLSKLPIPTSTSLSQVTCSIRTSDGWSQQSQRYSCAMQTCRSPVFAVLLHYESMLTCDSCCRIC